METIKIERNLQPVKIFDYFNDFHPAFTRYQQGEGPRPSPQVIVAFGQHFRADGEPFQDLLLSMTVSHPQADFLLSKVSLKIKRTNTFNKIKELFFF
jgi:hypothetical protein